MASFDIVSEVDAQNLDNAVNNLKKEILNRFDFQGSNTDILLNKNEQKITILTSDEMKIRQIQDSLISKLMKQKIDPGALDAGKEHYAAGNNLRKDILVRSGIDKDNAKKIIKKIKASKLKVQAQIMDEKVRVTGKKIDDLQAVMSLLKQEITDLPLQFVNMKR